MAKFNQKVHDRRYTRRSARAGLLRGGKAEHYEAELADVQLAKASPSVQTESAEPSEIRAALRRANAIQFNRPFSSLKHKSVLSPEIIEAMGCEAAEARVEGAVMERRSELARLVSVESKLVIMLLLNKDAPKSAKQLAQEFNTATSRIWGTPYLDDRFSHLMNATMVPARFVKKEQNGGRASYRLGPNGAAYGQAISFLALHMQSQHQIPMRDIFGHSGMHGDLSNGSLNRFLILERVSRGTARIKELCELVGTCAHKLKRHLDLLKELGILNYTIVRDDMIFGGFGKLPQKLAERGADGLTVREFKKLRVEMTGEGKETLNKLLSEMDRSARHRAADPALVQLAKAYSTDLNRLGVLVRPAITGYLNGIRVGYAGRNGQPDQRHGNDNRIRA